MDHHQQDKVEHYLKALEPDIRVVCAVVFIVLGVLWLIGLVQDPSPSIWHPGKNVWSILFMCAVGFQILHDRRWRRRIRDYIQSIASNNPPNTRTANN